jgi:hypothetical protein
MNAGLSREALGAAVFASAGLVQALEEEHRPPSETMAGRISRALGLDPWADAVLRSVAVDDAELRTRRGTRHVNRRSHAHRRHSHCHRPVPATGLSSHLSESSK